MSHIVYDELSRTAQSIQNYENGVYGPAYPDEDIITTYTYDVMGRQFEVADPLGHVRQTQYDALSRATGSIIDPLGLGLETSTEYDVAGRAVERTNGENEIFATTYDARGRSTVSIVDPNTLNLSSYSEYDALGRPIRTSNPDGIGAFYQYDNLGRLVTVIENAITEDCSQSTADSDVCTHYEYDHAGNLIGVTLGNSSQVDYSYDALGRMLEEVIDPSGVAITTAYTYDASGNRQTVTRAPGTVDEMVITYDVDALGRVTDIYYVEGSQNPDVEYSYDAFGNRSEMGSP